MKVWITGLPPFWERVASSACHLFVLWLLYCISLSFPLVLEAWCGSDCISSWVLLFTFNCTCLSIYLVRGGLMWVWLHQSLSSLIYFTVRVKCEGKVSQSFFFFPSGSVSRRNPFYIFLQNVSKWFPVGLWVQNPWKSLLVASIWAVRQLLMIFFTCLPVIQLMFNPGYINYQEKRYVIHPQKTTALRRNVPTIVREKETVNAWTLGSKEVKVEPKLTHLAGTGTS